MGTWCKVGVDVFQNDRVIRAGQDGAVLYIQLLALNGRSRQDGVLSAGKAEPRYLATLLAGFEWDKARAHDALAACTEAGLVEVLDDGSLAISGWDDTWKPPMTDAERAARMRAAKRTKAGVDEKTKGSRDDRHSSETDKRDGKSDESHARKVGREEGRKEGGEPSIPSSRSPDSVGPKEEDQPPPVPPSDAATVDQRLQAMNPEQSACLQTLSEAGLHGRSPHKRIDLAISLHREGWNRDALRWLHEKLERNGRTMLELLHREARFDELRAWRHRQSAARRLDHCFGPDVDRATRDLTGDDDRAYEQAVALRYAYLVKHAETNPATDRAWTPDDVPPRYRSRLNPEGTGLLDDPPHPGHRDDHDD